MKDEIVPIKKITEAVVYAENPFIDEMIGEVKIKHKTQMLRAKNKDMEMMVVNQDGDISGHSAFMRTIQVDEDKFAKLYIGQLASLWELKKTSIKVLSYILSTLKPNEDKVYFDMKECLKYCEWSKTQSAYNGLLELVNAQIIARTEKSYFYYINPRIVFNGSRVTFMTTYIKRKKQLMLADPNQTSILEQPGVTTD